MKRGGEVETILRRFARDQWVRLHGTPRVTVLVGTSYARDLFSSWVAVTETPVTWFEGDDIDRCVRDACQHASTYPRDTVAIHAASATLQRWRAGRSDRLASMVDEGLVTVADPPASVQPSLGAGALPIDARSAAEAALYEALEATPATAGRFELNRYLSVRFGSVACEVDLLSRGDHIAIEIDGAHHFMDLTAYRRDRRKDLLLQTEGLLVIRVLAEDVMSDPRDAINTVCQALARRPRTP